MLKNEHKKTALKIQNGLNKRVTGRLNYGDLSRGDLHPYPVKPDTLPLLWWTKYFKLTTSFVFLI